MKYVLILSLIFVSCKTKRPVVELQEQLIESRGASVAPTQSNLIVSTLRLPLQAEAYDLIVLTLQKQSNDGIEEAQVFDPYKLSTPIPLEWQASYSLTVQAFKSGKELYSNQHCRTKKIFKALSGTNTLTVSLCASQNFSGDTSPIESSEAMTPEMDKELPAMSPTAPFSSSESAP